MEENMVSHLSESELLKEFRRRQDYREKDSLLNKSGFDNCYDPDWIKIEKIIKQAFKAGQVQTLKWVVKEVIGEYENDDDEIKPSGNYFNDIKTSVMLVRDELREEQRQLIKQKEL